MANWLAITIGRHIWAWRQLNNGELQHELAHVEQWRRHGVAFGPIYLLASLRSWRAGTGWYAGNRFEAEARAAAAAGYEAADRVLRPGRGPTN